MMTVVVATAIGCQSIDESKMRASSNGVDSELKDTDEYAWRLIKYSKNENSILEYISKFPNGKNINEARLRLRLIKIGAVK